MLSQDFIDILSAFTEEKVEYLLVGSYAMAFHGWARATGDIDYRVSVEEAWKNQEFIEMYGLKLPLIGKRELFKNKKATGRPKDQIDVLWMEGGEEIE